MTPWHGCLHLEDNSALLILLDDLQVTNYKLRITNTSSYAELSRISCETYNSSPPPLPPFPLSSPCNAYNQMTHPLSSHHYTSSSYFTMCVSHFDLCEIFTDLLSLRSRWITYSRATIQCNTVQNDTIRRSTIQYNAVRYDAMQYNTMQHNSIRCNTIQHNTI